MRIRFANRRVKELASGVDPKGRLAVEIVRKYCQRLAFIESAESELEFRAMKSLHFEKLKGSRDGQPSMRLNQQWRLILEFQRDNEGKSVCVVEIVDYHKG